MADKKKVSLEDMGIGANPQEKATGPDRGATRVAKDKNIEVVDISAMVDVKEKKSAKQKAEEEMMKVVDENIERTKKDLMENVITPFKEACIAASLEDEADKLDPNGDKMEETLDSITPQQANTGSTDEDLADLLGTKMDDDNFVDTKGEALDTFMEDPDEKEETLAVEEKPKEKKSPPKKETKTETEPKKDKELVQEPKEIVDAINTKDSNEIQETISDADLQEFLDEETPELTADEQEELKAQQKAFREEVLSKLSVTPVMDKEKVKKLRVASKPVSVNKVLKLAQNNLNTATWPLPNSGRLATYTALSGEEIENLNPDIHDRNMSAEMQNRLIFGTIFNHLVDSNKPATMEEWLKTINWFDINDIYFGVYLATFKNSNFVANSCTNDKCKNIFLVDTDYRKMIKYTDDECEEVYKKLISTAIDSTPDEVEEEIVPIGNSYAIGFRAPSVFDIIFGASSLDQAFRAKYANTIGNISYMANIYYITNDTLFPVDCKPVKDNPAKTMRNKIVAYYNILKTLQSDQYSVIVRTIEEINSRNKFMCSFHYPNATCPKCMHTVKREDDFVNPLTMLFTRHRLVQFANSMTE
jgi:hypothetical protein|nr:MAG TPA: hypothetical protein [Caudoviricetes sp.]